MKIFELLDGPTTTLLLGLVVGMGIVLHPVFFLVALLIATAALIGHVLHLLADHTHHHPNLTHRHP